MHENTPKISEPPVESEEAREIRRLTSEMLAVAHYLEDLRIDALLGVVDRLRKSAQPTNSEGNSGSPNIDHYETLKDEFSNIVYLERRGMRHPTWVMRVAVFQHGIVEKTLMDDDLDSLIEQAVALRGKKFFRKESLR